MTAETFSKNHLLLSLVPLDSPALPRQQELFTELASLGETAATKTVAATANSLAFRMGPHRAAVALAPTPIPWPRLEGPCETAWWWPAAVAKLRGHGSHLLVALRGESDDDVARAIALTRLTAAAATQVDAAGVFWGGGSLVHDPLVFIEEARKSIAEKLPLHLWIDFRIEGNDDGTYRLFTTGMKALGQMEIEIPHSRHEPRELFDFAGRYGRTPIKPLELVTAKLAKLLQLAGCFNTFGDDF